ncbi:hypothetical protein ACP70R_028137 [Stipagrostis hirtigluma subsp. patula]
MAAGRGRGSAKSGALVAGAALLCALALMAPAAEAGTTYVVGDDAGWTRHLQSWWLAGKTFRAGDVLVFKYDRSKHDLVVVTRSWFKKCAAPRGARVLNSGYDKVTLHRGTRYFICNKPGHCDAGMKLAVKVY